MKHLTWIAEQPLRLLQEVNHQKSPCLHKNNGKKPKFEGLRGLLTLMIRRGRLLLAMIGQRRRLRARVWWSLGSRRRRRKIGDKGGGAGGEENGRLLALCALVPLVSFLFLNHGPSSFCFCRSRTRGGIFFSGGYETTNSNESIYCDDAWNIYSEALPNTFWLRILVIYYFSVYQFIYSKH